jgi:hypothetical protein
MFVCACLTLVRRPKRDSLIHENILLVLQGRYYSLYSVSLILMTPT